MAATSRGSRGCGSWGSRCRAHPSAEGRAWQKDQPLERKGKRREEEGDCVEFSTQQV